MKPKILVADPEAMFTELVSYALEQGGFEVTVVNGSRSTLDYAKYWHPDLCILSSSLLPLSQFQLCCDLRRHEMADFHAPILMIGTDNDDAVRDALLECGVNDYLVKPFAVQEFLGCVRELLNLPPKPQLSQERKTYEPLREGQTRAGRFLLDLPQRALIVDDSEGKRVVEITPREGQILGVLMKQPETLVTREHLLQTIWGKHTAETKASNNLEVVMMRLRMKIETNPDTPHHLITVRGVGYRFYL